MSSLRVVEALERRQLLAAVVGRVFLDADGDDVRDAGESPVLGQTVYIDRNRDGRKQSSEWSAVSDDDGAYRINRSAMKASKSYTVRTVEIDGYASAAQRRVRLTGAKTAAPEIAADMWAATQPPAPSPGTVAVTISAYVDANKNGKRDAGEVDLNLIKFWDDPNINSYQDANEPTRGPGTVVFQLEPGQHSIKAIRPTGEPYYEAVSYPGYDITLKGGEAPRTVEIGYYRPPVYTGHVYEDRNGNGRRDAGEGVPGVTVFADANDNNHRDAEWGWKSEADGRYELRPHPGAYKFRPALLDGRTSEPGTYAVTVGGTNDTNTGGYDFKVRRGTTPTLGAIAGRFFGDLDGDGAQDTGEKAFAAKSPSQHVFLDFDRDGNQDTGETDATIAADGSFSFADLPPGTYRVAASTSNWTSPITTAPRDVIVKAGQTADAGGIGIGIGPKEQKYIVYVGAYNDADGDGRYDPEGYGDDPKDHWGDIRVAGRVIYRDDNNNGKRDAGESWLETSGYGKTDGFDLTAGTYTFREELPAGYKATGRAMIGWSATCTFAADGKIRLPGDLPSGKEGNNSELVFLSQLDLNASAPKTGEIRGMAFDDVNGSGNYDRGEYGLKGGQTVFLDFDDDGMLDTNEPSQALVAEIINQGVFRFTGLAAGTYRVRLAATAGRVVTKSALVTVARTQVVDYVMVGSVATVKPQ